MVEGRTKTLSAEDLRKVVFLHKTYQSQDIRNWDSVNLLCFMLTTAIREFWFQDAFGPGIELVDLSPNANIEALEWIHQQCVFL